MSEYQICKRCVMDNSSDSTIIFDENGYCNYCSDTLNRKDSEYFPNETGKKKLQTIISEIKSAGKNKKYDCIVGVSGGLDSSYILYLGYKYGLRMLAVHIDDGLDTEIAIQNIDKICKATNTHLIYVKPDAMEYKDAVLAFFKAGVPNVAIAQDNLIVAELHRCAHQFKIHYSLAGGNFSLESILQRGCTHNAFDLSHIKEINNKFGISSWKKLNFIGFFQKYVGERYFTKIKKIYPLNYIEYNLEDALKLLNEFCGYEYYGGKHYESVLTRFMQCYYLPEKFDFDKRKSHFSSMIVSGQITRDEALVALKTNHYVESGLFQTDFIFLANFFGITKEEFKAIIDSPAKMHSEYKISKINKLSPIARKCRKYLG